MFENQFSRSVVVVLVAWSGKMEIEHFKQSSGEMVSDFVIGNSQMTYSLEDLR